MNKPLGRKAYGSIGHLPGSKTGPKDKTVHQGQANICTSKSRDKLDEIIVTEKLDGSNVAIARIGNKIFPLTRRGYLANSSPFKQHHLFASWALDNIHWLFNILSDGEVLHGEWLAQAHGTIYDLYHPPFVAFDITKGGKRISYLEFDWRCMEVGVVRARTIHKGGPVSIEKIKSRLHISGHGVAEGEIVEGAVWRVERKGRFDFMAKWVDPRKETGKYLPKISGKNEIWNWRL
ncbi:MAG: RNA ligase family protein [Gammaproteobacteria bacterium]